MATETYLPKYKDKDEPVVINVASIAALDDHNGLFPVYAGTKHGILGFSRCLGFIANYQKNKIRMLTVCPGFTDTKIIADAVSQMTDQQKKAMESYPSQNQKYDFLNITLELYFLSAITSRRQDQLASLSLKYH